MSPYKLLLVAAFCFSASAIAQLEEPVAEEPQPEQQSVAPVVHKSRLARFYGGELASWQESIPMKNVLGETSVRMRSTGLFGHMIFTKNLPKSRWRIFQAWDAGLGKLQGQGDTLNLPDAFNNQLWFLGGVTYGYRYRTSSITEIGLSVPIYARLIYWKLDSGSSTNPGRDLSFTLGLKGQYIARIRKDIFLDIGITHQILWESTIWSFGLQYQIQ